jgi:lipopolysaccharide transport system ATP-binding protein
MSELLNKDMSKASDLVLKATRLGKEYRLYDTPRDRLKSLVTGRDTHRSHWSLQDVSFELSRGQCMGVIGDNGAGKSTLLKIMAGTLHPTLGELTRVGRVTAILELGAGFHPDFTGLENLYFGGNLIGISSAEMKALEASIIDFSELGEAISRPVKTYSSGMVVRLAFALVTAVEPSLLIVDEALAVGDQHFQKKCMDRINQFRNNGCSILFCSHSLYHVRQLCDQALWLNGGKVGALGDTESVLGAYEAHVRARERGDEGATTGRVGVRDAEKAATQSQDVPQGQVGQIQGLEIANLDVGHSGTAPLRHAADGAGENGAGENGATENGAGSATGTLAAPPLLQSRDLAVTVTARVNSGERPNFAVMLEQSHGVGITSVATHAEGAVPTEIAPGLWRITLTFTALPLHSGDYVVSAYLFDATGLIEYDKWYQHQHFRFVYPSKTPGLVRLPHRWS